MSREKVIGTVMMILGQIPGVISVATKYNTSTSLYQPSVYRDWEPLLLIPLGVGIAATWFAHKFSAIAMWILFPLMLALAGVVWFLFRFEVNSQLHVFNWALSYCVVAIFAAILYRFVIDVFY